ncbi:MAG TPA: MBL fold metallo-hydrolase [Anaerolineales bacterium]|nr:MBL fold metallo-hydrolase [Anaerolineales bacterium]
MKLTFHGAARTVTGSQHLLEVDGFRLLLECGLFQGRRNEAFEINRRFRFDPAGIDAVLLSHAHIDHSGNLPHLFKNGFVGPVYATTATRSLAEVMLLDSGKIHESDVVYLNRRREKRGEPPIEPLYTVEDARIANSHFEGIAYDRTFEPVPGVRAKFVDAGHILGSAAVVLDIETGGRTRRLWFSGDIGRFDKPLLRDPVMPEGADFLIMECTYGDKPHRDPIASYEDLLGIVRRTIERGGKVIIPAFAVGRTQELVYSLHKMIDNGDLPSVPIFVDSPLAVNVSDVFRKHRDCYDEETLTFIETDPHGGALGFHLINYVRSVEESKALNHRDDSMVIISASGMAETGRILHHLKNNIEDPRNTVLIVSWMAPHTLGRRLAEREQTVRIFGETYQRRCEVAILNGFSAHAGQDALIDYALHTRSSVQKIFLVHGEPRGAEPLMDQLKSRGLDEIYYPEPHSIFDML